MSRYRTRTGCVLLAAAAMAGWNLGLAEPAGAADWPHFRGPLYDGVSAEKDWNVNWGDAGPKTAWKTSVGKGAASFVVQGNQVITTGNRNDTDTVWCLNLDSGKVLWRYDYPSKFDKRSFEGGTSATPTIAGSVVYNLGYDGQLQCLSMADGKLVWKRHLVKDFRGDLARWKYAGSPLLTGGLLIIDNGGNGNSTLALDPKTGNRVWGVGSQGAGYASPIPFRSRGKPAVLVFKGKSMVAVDLDAGEELWDVPWETSYDVNASSPSVLDGGNKVLISSGYGGGRAALFDVSGARPKQLWRNDSIKTKMSSCVVVNGFVYAVSGDNDGNLSCTRLSDGKTQWERKGYGFGTLMAAGDKLLVLSEKGTLSVVRADPKEFQEISQAQVLGKRCWVMPVLANGRILCKNNEGDVVCLDVRS
ncbi:MAG TPA: PQQ-binding-like beta-propeller repeat protein [Verrucomicrobiales bacterium]|nr:PQQ-binding-like beta-propeller repeat protein [Verrucomicrobiales bacterium]